MPVPNESNILETLVQWTIQQAESVHRREAAEHAIGAILNKRVDSEFQVLLSPIPLFSSYIVYTDLAEFLSHTLDAFWAAEVVKTDSSPERRKKAISLWTWVRFKEHCF